MRSPYMLPDVAVVDPELTMQLPPSVTASTGLDALIQCIEPFVSCKANPITDALALQGDPLPCPSPLYSSRLIHLPSLLPSTNILPQHRPFTFRPEYQKHIP